MLTVWWFLFGLVCGSFANAVIWRLKVGRSVAHGRSICPNCKHQLNASDLVPVVSWIVLKGRCRYCAKPISPQYPIVELITGALFGFAWLFFTPVTPVQWLDFLFWLYLIVILVILAVYDLRWMILPDKVLIPAIVIAVARLPILLLLGQPISVVRGPLIAAVLTGGVFYLLAAVSRGKWMGGGDIKLVFLLGLSLGIQKTILALFLATGAASVIGLALMATKRMKSHYIAFGPFLAAAAIASLFFGDYLIAVYASLSGLEYLGL